MFNYTQKYRALNNGIYPQTFHDFQEMESKELGNQEKAIDKVMKDLVNSDSAEADYSFFREKANRIVPYELFNVRQDGTAFSSPKDFGTKNLLSLTHIYNHDYNADEKIVSGWSGFGGFDLVLWDTGQVEPIPYDQVLYVFDKELKDTEAYAYYDEAGIPDERTLTYQEFWGDEDDGNNNGLTSLSATIGKPLSNANSKPVIDNGGPEAIINLSRLLSYPNRYGIARDELWKFFDPAREEFTFPQVQAGASKLNLTLQLHQLSLEEIQQLNAPTIFLNKEDKRIVTLSTLDDKEAIIVDRGLTRIVSRELLTKRYGGEALVPLFTATSESQIVAENPIRVLTLQSKTEEISSQVTLTNRGTQPLALQIERPIPGVTKATLSDNKVAPGQSVTLSLQIKWRDILKGDSQSVFVFVKTDDPLRPRLPLGFELRAPQAQ